MKKRISYLLIMMLVVVTEIGLSVGVWNYTSKQSLSKETTIVLNKQEQSVSEMAVNLTGICPGESVSYEICLKAKDGDTFNVEIDFEKTGEDSLAKFIDVTIMLGETEVGTAKLDEYLKGKRVTFEAQFNGEQTLNVEIVYDMKPEVGDEAQNTIANFKVSLTAK